MGLKWGMTREQFAFQFKMPRRKLRSEMGLLNARQHGQVRGGLQVPDRHCVLPRPLSRQHPLPEHGRVRVRVAPPGREQDRVPAGQGLDADSGLSQGMLT